MGEALHVVLAETEVEVGGMVRGRVEVLESFADATALDVSLQCGGTRTPMQVRAKARLREGPIAAGEKLDFALQVPPDAPFDFEGHARTIAWVAEARVDAPWKIDPKVSAAFRVRPRVVSAAELEDAIRVPPTAPPQQMHIIVRVILGVLVAMVVICLLPILPFLLVIVANKKIVATRVADYVLEIPDRHFALGEWVPVTVRFRLKRAIHVKKMSLGFHGTEQWSTGSGKTRSTHRHHFHEQEQVVLEDTVLGLAAPSGKGGAGAYRSSGRARRTGPIVEWKTAVQIPHDGLPSVGGQTVYYSLKAKTNIRGIVTSPNAGVLVRTVGARLEGGPARPETPPIQESSGDIVFVPPGATAPPGVVAVIHGGGVWRWIALSTLGICAAVGGAAVSIDTPDPIFFVMLAAGLAALVAGLVGFWIALYR